MALICALSHSVVKPITDSCPLKESFAPKWFHKIERFVLLSAIALLRGLRVSGGRCAFLRVLIVAPFRLCGVALEAGRAVAVVPQSVSLAGGVRGVVEEGARLRVRYLPDLDAGVQRA